MHLFQRYPTLFKGNNSTYIPFFACIGFALGGGRIFMIATMTACYNIGNKLR